jgi:hypothetical protein
VSSGAEIEGCLAARGYAVDSFGRRISLGAPAGATGLPDGVHVPAARGVRHLLKHTRVLKDSEQLVELLRLTWRPSVRLVVETRSAGREAEVEALVWMLESENFKTFFQTRRLKGVTKPCQRVWGTGPICDEPAGATLRSLQTWGPVSTESPIRWPPACTRAYALEYLTLPTELHGSRHKILDEPRVARACWGMSVAAISLDGQTVTLSVKTTRAQTKQIREDRAGFIERHFIEIRGLNEETGTLDAAFVERP